MEIFEFLKSYFMVSTGSRRPVLFVVPVVPFSGGLIHFEQNLVTRCAMFLEVILELVLELQGFDIDKMNEEGNKI